MAVFTHTTYACDRCKADLGDKEPKRPQGAVVDASFHWTEGPGPHFTWRHLCDRCDTTVKAFFLSSVSDLSFRQSELAEARQWWDEVREYANKDMAAYIMARARRMLGGWKP
jgi:hypothetical protein